MLVAIGSALGQLGYKGIYHMRDVILYPDHADQWRKALEAKYEGQGKRFGREEFDQFLKGYTVGLISALVLYSAWLNNIDGRH